MFENNSTDIFPAKERIATDGNLELYYHSEDSSISILNKDNGSVWSSNPSDAKEDPIAQGAKRMALQSQLVVSYLDAGKTEQSVNSTVGSVRQKTCLVKSIDGGIKVLYHFSRTQEDFSIPVSYILKNKRLQVTVHYDEIKENGEARILKIDVLPFFGAGKQDTTGTLFVPDGCGALMDFKSDRTFADNYQKCIYGSDPSLSDYAYTQSGEKIRLPVFGVVKEQGAFYTEVIDCAENSWISAVQAGKQTSYASVNAGFYYRYSDSVKLTAQYSQNNNVAFLAKNPVPVNPQLQYTFLSGKDATVVGIAKNYRADLLKRTGAQEKTSERVGLTLETVAGVQNKESFLGLMIHRVRPVTTLENMEKMLKNLQEKQVNSIDVMLYYISKKANGNSLPASVSIDRHVGSLSDFYELEERQSARDSRFYFGYDYVNVPRSKFGYWKFNSAVKSVFSTNVIKYAFNPSINASDTDSPLSYYLRPSKIGACFEQILRQKGRLGKAGVCLNDMGSVVYSDFNSRYPADRTDTAQAYIQAYKAGIKAGIPMAADGANGYLLGLSEKIINVPVTSSKHDAFSGEIPFYQIVVQGIADISSTPLNYADDSRICFLRCLMTGTQMNYRLTGTPCTDLQDTNLQYIYNGYYSDWMDEIVAQYEKYNAVRSQVKGSQIVGFEASGALETMIYENGVRITINLSNTDSVINGQKIAAYGYLVDGGNLQN
ncbi:MAG: DUF5696 domain-containing protein [Clostridiales bacterium]|nr:DUF5696 domain-containing protein [Clostridiales bacterium]